MANGYPQILHDNRLDDATPVASTTATGYDVLNLRDWRPYTWWKPTALPATVTVDCASPVAADYFLIWGHDLFTHGCTVELRGSTDNFVSSNVLIASKITTSNDPFFVAFTSVSFRYWRLNITGGATMPSIAIASIGTALDIHAYFASGFDPIGRDVIGQYNQSMSGHPLGKAIRYEEWSQTLNFENVTWSWLRATWQPAWSVHLRKEPFVLVWDSVDHADELRLVVAQNGYRTPHSTGSYANLSLDVMGVI